MKNILVINAGSSSLKYQLIDIDTETVIAKGLCERIGIEGSQLTYKSNKGDKVEIQNPMPNHEVAIKMVLDILVDKKVGVSSGSTSAKALTKAMIEAGLIDGSGFDADTFDPALWTTGISFQQYDDYPAISTALSAGEVDAFCVDKSILAIYKTEGRSYIDDKFSPQEYGVATTKGSGLSAYVDELIQGWLADGTIDSLITENGLE